MQNRELRPTARFRRDVRRMKKRGHDLSKLKETLDILQKTGCLPDKYRPHPLRGDFQQCMDAHIGPDWLLIYEVLDDGRMIVLRRTGTHQDIFRIY